MSGPFSHAKEYRKAGWRGTLWLPEGKKDEPPTGFTGHGAPYPSDLEVRQWMKAHPTGNICLHLAEVEYGLLREGLPVVYDGNNVDGWELIGIDVDDYTPKKGYEQLLALEQQLGPLPHTVVSSARWETSPLSGTRIFLVPKGFRYKGKAAATGHVGPKNIDILYAGLRYLVVWPSTNPHADGALYRFRYGRPGDEPLEPYDGVPPLSDVDLLPEAWFKHLLAGVGSDADDKSDMDFGELNDWAAETFRDVQGRPCDLMTREVNKYNNELDESDSHHPLNDVIWRLTRNALEGHSGWHTAVMEYLATWQELARGKRDLEEMQGEVLRSIDGALAKAKAEWDRRDGYMPDEKCGDSYGDPVAWAEQHLRDAERLAEADYGGLGPVVGKLAWDNSKPADEYQMNDRGNGQHFIDIYGDDIKYVDARRSWIIWDGERWHRDSEDKLVSLAFSRVEHRQREYAGSIQRDDKENILKSRAWYKWALKSGNASTIKNAISLSRGMYSPSGERVALSGSEFDDKPELLGCTNGTLVLDDNPDVRPPVKEDYVTYNTRVPYVPWRTLAMSEGETFEGYELWTEYLDKFLPDKKIQRFVQKVMGHLLQGGNPEKLIVFLWGPHDTGKSTMLGAIAGALGDYCGSIDTKLFKEQDKNPALVRAVPLRVTTMSEADAGIMDGAKIKQLTGNDKVTAELKYSNDIFEGTPQFTTIIATNNPPSIKHSDEALVERLLVLPFLHEMPRRERKFERQREIETHSGVAVLSWLVEGWKMYRAELLKRDSWPIEVKRHNRDFSANLNATQMFIRDCLERARDTEHGRRAAKAANDKAVERKSAVPTVIDWDTEWTPTAESVYELYLRWCRANGVMQPDTALALCKDLGVGKAQNRRVEGKARKCYVGLRIKQTVVQSGTGWRVK